MKQFLAELADLLRKHKADIEITEGRHGGATGIRVELDYRHGHEIPFTWIHAESLDRHLRITPVESAAQ